MRRKEDRLGIGWARGGGDPKVQPGCLAVEEEERRNKQVAFLPGGHTRSTAQSSRPFIEFCPDLFIKSKYEKQDFNLNNGYLGGYYPIVMIYPCMSFQRGLLASNVSITPLN